MKEPSPLMSIVRSPSPSLLIALPSYLTLQQTIKIKEALFEIASLINFKASIIDGFFLSLISLFKPLHNFF